MEVILSDIPYRPSDARSTNMKCFGSKGYGRTRIRENRRYFYGGYCYNKQLFGDGKQRQKSETLINRIKSSDPMKIVVLTGCFPQAFPETASKLSADIVTGTEHKDSIADMIDVYRQQGKAGSNTAKTR